MAAANGARTGLGTNAPQQRAAQAGAQPRLKPSGLAHPAEYSVFRPIRNGAQIVTKIAKKTSPTGLEPEATPPK
jgi:hypothetical protein